MLTRRKPSKASSRITQLTRSQESALQGLGACGHKAWGSRLWIGPERPSWGRGPGFRVVAPCIVLGLARNIRAIWLRNAGSYRGAAIEALARVRGLTISGDTKPKGK